MLSNVEINNETSSVAQNSGNFENSNNTLNKKNVTKAKTVNITNAPGKVDVSPSEIEPIIEELSKLKD